MPRRDAAHAYFDDNLRVQARFLRHASETARRLAEALIARSAGRAEESREGVARAADAARAMADALAPAARPPFERWYDDERHFYFRRLRDDLRALAAAPAR